MFWLFTAYIQQILLSILSSKIINESHRILAQEIFQFFNVAIKQGANNVSDVRGYQALSFQ